MQQLVEGKLTDSTLPKEHAIVRTVDPCSDRSWDDFVLSHPGATIFHTSAWARVLRDTYGHVPHYLIAEGFGQSVGGICLIELRSWLKGKRAVGLPFTDDCPVLEGAGAGFQVLWDTALELARARGWRSVELRGTGGSPIGSSVEFLTHTLALEDGSEMFRKLAAPFRTAIRKAEKAGITTSIENSFRAIEEYYSLHCVTRRKHGAPPQPFRFFANIFENVIKPGLGFVALAQHENRPVAGAVFFHFRGKAVYKFGASDLRAVNLRPNNLLMWKAIEHLQGFGCKTLNFGRTSLSNEGLRRFKLGWGSHEERLQYAQYDCTRQKCVTTVDRSDGIHTALFSRLPIPFLKRIGATLYPHLD